ncbi:NepR family anti-sigma factor [Zavarzinia sp. CC-PAN008]|uniref:NepR family anti-sigma factor n=1 Tax=Zavarzinia sp. CC-PAN008 TaxID=3243332 RepID=UPI003F7455EC
MQQDGPRRSGTAQVEGTWSALEPAARGGDQAFQRQLQSLYSDVMKEPVPDDLLDLVRRIDAKRSNQGHGS